MFRLIASTIIFTLFAGHASACPLIDDTYIDFNCDQKLKIAVIGDSVVWGIGDNKNNNEGGYPKRLASLLGHKVSNLGDPGATSLEVLHDLMATIDKRSTKRKLKNTDVIIFDVGRNDYWKDETPEGVARNIKRSVQFLKKKLNGENGLPYFIVSTLIPTKRAFQQPFIDEVNAALLRMKSRNLPVKLYFHKLKPKIISNDLLHPNSRGYKRIAKFLFEYFNNELQVLEAKKRLDEDIDGIFDRFESKYLTDKSLNDTDGDTYLDGAEVFELGTDPLDPLDPPVLE